MHEDTIPTKVVRGVKSCDHTKAQWSIHDSLELSGRPAEFGGGHYTSLYTMEIVLSASY